MGNALSLGDTPSDLTLPRFGARQPRGETASRSHHVTLREKKFTDEQKAQAVKLVRDVGSISQAAKDLDLTESALRNWVRQADIDAGSGPRGHRSCNQVLSLSGDGDFFKPCPDISCPADDIGVTTLLGFASIRWRRLHYGG